LRERNSYLQYLETLFCRLPGTSTPGSFPNGWMVDSGHFCRVAIAILHTPKQQMGTAADNARINQRQTPCIPSKHPFVPGGQSRRASCTHVRARLNDDGCKEGSTDLNPLCDWVAQKITRPWRNQVLFSGAVVRSATGKKLILSPTRRRTPHH
jgi:hypothetical protein